MMFSQMFWKEDANAEFIQGKLNGKITKLTKWFQLEFGYGTAEHVLSWMQVLGLFLIQKMADLITLLGHL